MPRLRKICSERDVVLRYVDLRWGVTGKQSEQATMLLMCLRELSQSNLFVGCYGERYAPTHPPTYTRARARTSTYTLFHTWF
jgi:telomerase protein component 1